MSLGLCRCMGEGLRDGLGSCLQGVGREVLAGPGKFFEEVLGGPWVLGPALDGGGFLCFSDGPRLSLPAPRMSHWVLPGTLCIVSHSSAAPPGFCDAFDACGLG